VTRFPPKADGTFEDVSVKAGVNDPQKYYGFSSHSWHADDDNLLDLIVVNDSTPKQLYINKGDGTFEETGYPSGIALNENGREQAGMGLAIGDYDNDGKVDFHITNFSMIQMFCITTTARKFHRRYVSGRDRRGDASVSRLGHGFSRLRQRRMGRPFRRQRSRLSDRRRTPVGHELRSTVSAVSQSAQRKV
jgi:hypothetical protein